MKMPNFFSGWDATRSANRMLLGVVAVLAFSNVFLAGKLALTHTQIRLIPPTLTKAVDVGYLTADADYYKAWGLYVAEMVGNLTPQQADFVATSVSKLFEPSQSMTVRNAIVSQGAAEEAGNVVTFFQAKQTIWQPATSTVFVYGKQRTMSPAGSLTASGYLTVQMNIKMLNGRPVLSNLMTYEDAPHTLTWIEAHPTPKTPAQAASGVQ